MTTPEPQGFIYGLTDPRTGEVRYIGRTAVNPWRRYRSHIGAAIRRNEFGHKGNWIRELGSLGLTPGFILIESNVTREELDNTERWWIAAGHRWGWRLTNQTAGGGGTHEWSEDSRDRLSRTLKGRVFTKEHREALRQASTGRRHSQEVIDRIAAANRGKKLSEEHKDALCHYWVGKKHSEEHRRRVSEAKTGGHHTSETKRLISKKAKQRPPISQETRQKLSSSSKGRTMSEETRQRMSNAAKRRWALKRGEVI